MKMTKEVVVILSHLPWNFPSDYIKQTSLELTHKADVIVLNPVSLPSLRQLIFGGKIDYGQPSLGKRVIHFPSVGIFPFQRLEFIRKINVYLNFVLFRLFYLVKYGFQKPIFWCFSFRMTEILPLLSWGKILLYDRVDHPASMVKQENQIIQKKDRLLLKRANLIFTNSPYALKYIKKYNKKSFLVPCGCATELFTQYKTHNTKHTTPVIGLVGSLDHRLNYNLLLNLAQKRKDWNFVFIGSPFSQEMSQFKIVGLPQRLGELKRLTNVHFLGEQKKEKLPALIAGFDVCLIPYDINQELVRGCNPMKLYEYLVMGKPVVSTPIEAVKQYQPVVKIAGDSQSFDKEIENCLEKKYNQQEIIRRQKISLDNSWENKVKTIWGKLI